MLYQYHTKSKITKKSLHPSIVESPKIIHNYDEADTSFIFDDDYINKNSKNSDNHECKERFSREHSVESTNNDTSLNIQSKNGKIKELSNYSNSTLFNIPKSKVFDISYYQKIKNDLLKSDQINSDDFCFGLNGNKSVSANNCSVSDNEIIVDSDNLMDITIYSDDHLNSSSYCYTNDYYEVSLVSKDKNLIDEKSNSFDTLNYNKEFSRNTSIDSTSSEQQFETVDELSDSSTSYSIDSNMIDSIYDTPEFLDNHKLKENFSNINDHYKIDNKTNNVDEKNEISSFINFTNNNSVQNYVCTFENTLINENFNYNLNYTKNISNEKADIEIENETSNDHHNNIATRKKIESGLVLKSTFPNNITISNITESINFESSDYNEKDNIEVENHPVNILSIRKFNKSTETEDKNDSDNTSNYTLKKSNNKIKESKKDSNVIENINTPELNSDNNDNLKKPEKILIIKNRIGENNIMNRVTNRRSKNKFILSMVNKEREGNNNNNNNINSDKLTNNTKLLKGNNNENNKNKSKRGRRPKLISDKASNKVSKKNVKKAACGKNGHFICKECGKDFPRKSNHDSHIRLHLKVKPHICKFCSKGFVRRSDLNRHERSLHLKTSFRCFGNCKNKKWGCGHFYSRKDGLRKHWKSAQGSKCLAEFLKVCKIVENKYEEIDDIDSIINLAANYWE